MGSYKWGDKRVISIATLLITLFITTHEPPSKGPCAQIVYILWPEST